MRLLCILFLLVLVSAWAFQLPLVEPRKFANDISRALCSRPLSDKSPPVSQIEDDGYNFSHSSRRKAVRSLLAFMQLRQPGTLIMIRHGESVLNLNKTFTGWIDADMNERGIREVEHAARLLMERGLEVDVIYTSRLKRAIRSSWIIMRELNQIYRPVYKSWRLNERMYGALEGLSKPGVAQELGEDIVQAYRTGLSARPPPMQPGHPFWHRGERKYADLRPDDIPLTESLQDTMERTLPLWKSRILPDLRAGRTVMIVAHANSLRGVLKHIDKLTPEQIQTVAIPNGIPLVYKFDKHMRPMVMEGAVSPINGEFLEKKGLLRAALEKEAELASRVPGYDALKADPSPPIVDARLRGLLKLDEARKLMEDNVEIEESAPTATGIGAPSQSPISWTPIPKKKSADAPLVVIISHGKTEYNKLGVFTGWEDAPLSNEGRAEARQAGQVLKMHGIELDVVYTSWLSRAIETAWLVLEELDSLWLPINKSWRLNERMYGALTGLSKKMIAQRHGEAKFKEWRRSYATRPPSITSFSSSYPGNDDRYVKYARDLRISVSESLIRSLSQMKLVLHRKFPKTESLKVSEGLRVNKNIERMDREKITATDVCVPCDDNLTGLHEPDHPLLYQHHRARVYSRREECPHCIIRECHPWSPHAPL